MSLKELKLRKTTKGKGKLLNTVIKPGLELGAVSFKALTAYYSTKSLETLGKSLDIFLSKDGIIQIVIGDQLKDTRTLEAAQKEWVPETDFKELKDSLINEAKLVRDRGSRLTLATLAYLMLDDKLQIKVASYEGGEIWHPKMYLIEDSEGNKLSATGSGNMTGDGFENNYEIHKIFTTWDFGQDYFESTDPEDPIDEEIFETIWTNREEHTEVRELDKDYAKELLEALGNPTREEVEAEKDIINIEGSKSELLKDLQKSPIYHEFNLGESALYPHQIFALQKALKMWPIRILFADEVGLGKTLELGSLIAYLYKNKIVNKILILCPPPLTEQWQEEMSLHFGLDFARFDREKDIWKYLDEHIPSFQESRPLRYNDNFPDLAIMSKSMAVRSKEKHIFLEDDVYPDLLVVDEAHHARAMRNKDNTIYKTVLRRVLENLENKIPHVAFATATPMRKDVDEYYFLLELLGLNYLINEDEYKDSLRIIAKLESTIKNNIYDLDDLSKINTILKKLLNQSDISFYKNNNEIKDLLEKINSSDVGLDYSEVHDNSEDLIRAHITLHPTKILTSRNVQENLNQFPETYKIPKRILRPSEINDLDIPPDVHDFFNGLMEYVENFYQMTEMALDPEKTLPIALRKHSLQERFASSFWAAKKSLETRKEKLERDIEYFKQGQFSPKGTYKISAYSEEEDIEEIERDEGKLLEKINWELVIEQCESEISALSGYINFSERIINQSHDGQNPDPKINEVIRLVKKHFDEKPNTPFLIFSKYTDTLDKVEEAVTEFCENNMNYVPGYASYRGDKKRAKYRNSREEVGVTKTDITRGLKSGRILFVFCSSAAGEGLNLQAASYMINVDVPWIPSDLEQRIGRIARLGQKESEVIIDNIWYPYSIESEMYRRLIERQRKMSFAIGEYPDLIAEGIKDLVDTGDQTIIDKTIENINKQKNSEDMRVLNKLWTTGIDGSIGKPTGNIFREKIISLMDKVELNIDSISSTSGSLDVFHFNLYEFEKLFNQKNESTNHNADLIGLYFEENLWGFQVKTDGTNNLKVINPIDLPNILNSFFTGDEINSELYDLEITSNKELINFYLDIEYPTILPLHYQFLLYDVNENIPFKYMDKPEKKLIGRITI
ncbi:MAG: hypothetical protein CBC54_005470 [Rhizobiales bacterium TMED94]|nr:MAG: hypothetical protein CBC54_005470 [Rhizobiales bacterium TMED94]